MRSQTIHFSPIHTKNRTLNANYINGDDRVILFSGISKPNDTILRFPAFPTLTAVLNYTRCEVCLQNSILITLPFFKFQDPTQQIGRTTRFKQNNLSLNSSKIPLIPDFVWLGVAIFTIFSRHNLSILLNSYY